MSELINTRGWAIRHSLLANVSMIALLGTLSSLAASASAASSDGDQPTVWIDLGGELDKLNNAQEAFAPPFVASITRPGFLSTLNVQHPPTYAIDAEGRISIQPENSDWVFSASVLYGRSQSSHQHHQQTPNAAMPIHFTVPQLGGAYVGGFSYYPSQHNNFADGAAKQSERHTILDFQAGKDVGLGLFGVNGSSVLSAGVRYAQFTSKTNVALRALPDLQYPTGPITSLSALVHFKYHPTQLRINFHAYTGIANMEQSFQGWGPSLSWNASMPMIGSSDNGELALDWTANASLLFGRQKAQGHHQTTTIHYQTAGYWVNGGGPDRQKRAGGFFATGTKFNPPPRTSHSIDINRTHSVSVPNLGGSIGLSYRIADFKVSLGYRGDFFFGAMDGGIDAAKKETRGFYGPFASVSVGLGG